jgi:copper resistance protein C
MNRLLVHRTGWRLLTVLALMVTTGVGGAGAVSAHDTLVGTSPAASSTVPTVPGSVTLSFEQPALALGTQLVVTGPGGPVQSGAARAVDNTVTQTVQPGAPAGRYTVLWRVTSVDGHPVSGRFTFTAKAAAPGTRPAGGAAPASTPSAHAAGGAGGAVREVAFTVAVVLVVGGVALFRRRRSQG